MTLLTKRQFLRDLFQLVLALVLTAAVVRLFRAAEIDSQDFRVYWKAAHAWISGQFPYLVQAADQGFVFKYPPWMLPLFAPLGWIGFEFAKGAWAVAELVAIGYCYRWLLRNGVSRAVGLLTLALFWYLWLAHLYAGQFTIFLLACALWAADATPVLTGRAVRETALGVLFTVKVFSAYSLAGLWRRIFRKEVLLGGLGFFVVMNGILLLRASAWGGDSAVSAWLELYRGWMAAAASGATELGWEVVRGTGNHGFVAAILRWVDPFAQHPGWDAPLSLALAVGLGWLWARRSRELPFEQKWAGWLAYGVIVHPLAWHHSFVMAFPLAAYAIEESLRTRRRGLLALALLGTCLIGILVPQVVGKTLVKPFELVGNKSWGVLLCAYVLLRARALAVRKTA